MPEIHFTETNVRNRFNLPDKSNPDLKIGTKRIDVKSPFSAEKIVTCANDAARQGSTACITDDRCIITKESISYWKRLIFSDNNYNQDEVHFVIDGVLYTEKR